MRVEILCTCRKPELLPMTLLVFDTLRIGFPTARVIVHGNALPDYAEKAVREACEKNVCEFSNGSPTIHNEWLAGLCEGATESFIVSDTDCIYYESVEGWKFDTALAGARIPEWDDEFSGAITRSRLHTSLLFIDPVKLRAAVKEYESKYADTVFTPKVNLFYPLCLPLNGKRYFHDTASLLYHAIGGTAFTDIQMDALFHFNFGTIPDVVLPRLSNGEEMANAREAVLKNPELGRGMWRAQREYYEQRNPAPKYRGIAVNGVSPENAAQARKWNHSLCMGDPEAMAFNDLWYRYCHGIDDLIDTMEDGRPQMNAEQILELFALAAAVYNAPFFVRHRDMLFPIALQVTNAYADSVAWERSPISRRRTMADVLRTCGNEMYNSIAMIKGGWSHLRDWGPKIRERDWIGQHDEQDRPN